MKPNRLLLALTLGVLSLQASAQTPTFPTKPIRLIVGFAPGGAADYVARSMGDAWGKALGQPIVIDNKPGNGSSIAAELAARAPADGHTVLIASPSSISVNPALNPKLGYAPKDLKPITKITTSPLVLAVNPGLGIKSVAELIADGKKNPNKYNYSTSGNGSAPHLGAALFTQITGMPMTHVPYRGGALAIQSVLAGDTQVTFGTSPSVLPFVTAGKLRALAVSTNERSPLVPDLPGMRDVGLPDYSLEFWYGLFVPANTPADVVKKLHDTAAAAMKQASVKAALEREGTEVSLSGSPEAFDKFLVDDSKFWVNLVRSANVKAE